MELNYIQKILNDTVTKDKSKEIEENEFIYSGKLSELFYQELITKLSLAGVEITGGNIKTWDGKYLSIKDLYSSNDILGVATDKYLELILLNELDIKLESDNEQDEELVEQLILNNIPQIKKLVLQQSIAGDGYLKMTPEGKMIVPKSKYCAIIPAKNNIDEVYAYVFSSLYKQSNGIDHKVVAEIHTKEEVKTVVFAYNESSGLTGITSWDEQTLGKKPNDYTTKSVLGYDDFLIDRVRNECSIKTWYSESDYTEATKNSLKTMTTMESMLDISLSKYILPILTSNVVPDERINDEGESYNVSMRDHTAVDENIEVKYAVFDPNYKHNEELIKRKKNDILKSMSLSEAILGDFSEISSFSGVSLNKLFYNTRIKANSKWMFIELAIRSAINKYFAMNKMTNKVIKIEKDNEIVVGDLEREQLRTIKIQNNLLEKQLEETE